MFDIFKDKYYAIIVKSVNATDVQIAKKSIKPDKTTLKYKELSTVVDFSKVVWRNKNKSFLLFRYDTTGITQLTTSDKMFKVDNSLIDTILNNAVITQIVSGLGTAHNNIPLIFSIVMLITGILAGYFLGSVYPYSQIAESLKNIKWW